MSVFFLYYIVDDMSSMMTLPFVYTNKSISDWLSQFPASEVLLMSNEVFKVLSTLKKHHVKIDPDSLAIAVKRLTPVVLHLSVTLRKAIMKHSQASKVAQLSIRTLYHLAFLHVYLARKVALKSEQVLHVNFAIQMIGIAFQHCALAYQRPSVVLWECLAGCYELANNANFLDMAVRHSIPECQALPTSSLALKRALLFWLANPYRLSQQDILTLFDFCTHNCSFVNLIESGMPSDRVFCWEYRTAIDYQPVYFCPDVLPDHCVLFDTYALINFENKQSLKIGAANLVMATFDQYHFLLENTKFTLSSAYVFVSRFDCVVDFFVKHVRHRQILTLNTPAPEDLTFSNLAMVKEKKQNDYELEKVSSADIWSYQQQEVDENEVLKLEFGAMKLVQTSLSLYFVAETMAVKLCVGNIFICYDSAFKPAMGITRCVHQGRRGTVKHSVVELCQGQVSLLQQSLMSVKTKLSALLLDNRGDKQLFVASAHYELGKALKFDQQEVTLERLIEVTPYFMRYQVVVCES